MNAFINFRHPLPTNKKLDHYAMVVLCGAKRPGLLIDAAGSFWPSSL